MTIDQLKTTIEVVKPFADRCKQLHPSYKDGDDVRVWVTAGDLRKAKLALGYLELMLTAEEMKEYDGRAMA